MLVDTIPLNREAGPEVRRHYRRLQVMETTGVSQEFIDGEESPTSTDPERGVFGDDHSSGEPERIVVPAGT